ncbi:MAG: hypothetical protein ACYC3X_05950 [Pirellulaceae bacterium]
MVYRMLGACCLALLVPGMLLAQTTAKTPEQLTKDVQDLQQNLTAAIANLTKVAEQVAKNTAAITTNAQGIERLTTIMNDELRKQQEILTRLDELTLQQQDQLARQQVILDTIAEQDSSGRDILRLSANMEQSEEFRDDVRKAVQQAMDAHGEVTIHNRMGSRQQIVVNHKEYGLGADEILTLKVPTGIVTAQLPGQPLTDWTLGAPNYSQKIEIVPEKNPTTTKVARPISNGNGNGSASTVDPLPTAGEQLAPLPPWVGPVVEYYVWPY